MTIVKHELRQGRISFLIWTLSIGLLLAICVLMFPSMQSQMESVGDMFAGMGAFTDAFGLNQLNFGSLIGFYAVEGGNILGLGGAFYAALLGASSLSKEEKERTAEFLLTSPVSRPRILMEKLAAVLIQIVFMNLIVFALGILSILLIKEEIPWKELLLLHSVYTIMQIQLAGICFGLSSVLHRGSAGAGIGLATAVYFLNLIANITEKAKSLKYLTPFAYCEAADLLKNMKPNGMMIAIGITIAVLSSLAGSIWYTKKDIH